MTESEFIAGWISSISSEGLKNFSNNLPEGFSAHEIPLPGKALVMGNNFFGVYEVLTTDGSAVFHSEDLITAKYILYANRNRPASMQIPIDKEIVKKAVNDYENYIDSLIKKIDADFKQHFQNKKDSSFVITAIFKALDVTRY